MQRGVTERCRHNLLCNWGQFLPRSFFTKNCHQFPSKTFQVDTFFPFLARSDVSIVIRNYFFLTIFCFSSRPTLPTLGATGCFHQNKEIRQIEGRHISLTEIRQPYLKRQLLQYSQSTLYHFKIIGMINIYMKHAHCRFLTRKLVKYRFARCSSYREIDK